MIDPSDPPDVTARVWMPRQIRLAAEIPRSSGRQIFVEGSIGRRFLVWALGASTTLRTSGVLRLGNRFADRA